jgi:hypothetical protein
MPTITLAAKSYNGSQLRKIKENLNTLLEGLKVEIKTCKRNEKGWTQLDIAGEDTNIALRYLDQKIGTCPTTLDEISKFSTTKGYLTNPSKSKTALDIDVGIATPQNVTATIPLQSLQAQLCDGKKLPLEKISEIYAFCENLPINVKVSSVDKATKHIEAELTEKQQNQYKNWTDMLLDRLIIVRASADNIKLALKYGGLTRDVIDVEPLGFFEHALICKLGTDARGLIPRMGRNLKEAAFAVFSPRRIQKVLENTQTASIST